MVTIEVARADVTNQKQKTYLVMELFERCLFLSLS